VKCNVIHSCPICGGTGKSEHKESQYSKDVEEASEKLKKLQSEFDKSHSNYKWFHSKQ
jgi:uncharacterized Zn finger protein (UPF0148 family)